MDKAVLQFVIEKTHDLMMAPSCSKEAKEAARNWLAAVGTDKEANETQKYFAELEGDIMPIDMLIEFADSEQGTVVFGADMAKNIASHARQIKTAGAKYCDCPACSAVAAILEKKNLIL